MQFYTTILTATQGASSFSSTNWNNSSKITTDKKKYHHLLIGCSACTKWRHRADVFDHDQR